MPKEVVYDPTSPFHRVEIGWSPGDRVGVTVSYAICAEASDLNNREREGLHELIGEDSLVITGWNHIACDLNRDGINRMIRALRKARDAAFGADA